jgi:hypothetical protein
MEPHTFPPQGRFGHGFVVPGHPLDSGTSSVEWAIFALVLAVLLLVAANLALAWAARTPRGAAPSPAPPPGFGGGPRRGGPFAVLGERYARGEIDRDEFLRTADDLRAAQSPPSDAPTVEAPPREDDT